MKIGILVRELDVSGGTQRLSLCLAKELLDAGEDVRLFGVQVDCSRCYPELSREISPVDLGVQLPTAVRQPGVRRILDRFQGNSPAFLLNRRLAELLPDDLDVLNVHEHFVYAAGAFWKERTGKPVVWFMNDMPGEFLPGWDPRHPWRKLDRLLNGREREAQRLRELAGKIDEILVHSSMEGMRLNRATGLTFRVVSGGLDLRAFPFRPRCRSASVLRLLSNGIFYPHRRLEDIVSALVLLKGRGVPFRWDHVGTSERSPEYAMKILRMTEEAGLASDTEFLGVVSHEELVRCYQAADIFLFPNSPQSWGLAPFEAMSCGAPVVISRGAGASEILAHRENCLLVDPRSPHQVAEMIEELWRNPALWITLHEGGRRFVEQNIRWDLFARRVLDVFRRVQCGELQGIPGDG